MGLIHQVKQFGMKDANTIKAINGDRPFRKSICDQLSAQIQETARVIAEIKLKLIEIDKKRIEILREVVVCKAVNKYSDRASSAAKLFQLKSEIEELTVCLECLFLFSNDSLLDALSLIDFIILLSGWYFYLDPSG